MRNWILFFGFALMTACTASRKIAANNVSAIKEIRFINEYVLPSGLQLNNTTVGGLSGIDYDATRDVYYMICDDPSTKGPARFYTAKIILGTKGIDSVQITAVTPVLNPQHQTYADITKDRIHSADLEALRYDRSRNELVWTSEGQRYIRDDKQELQDPQIVIITPAGQYKDSFELPQNMHIQAKEKGPRHNSVFEGVSFDETYKHIFVSVEDALYDDGPKAGTGDSTAWIRIMKFDRETKKQVAQYAYKVDPVPHAANPPGAFKINGVSDILYIGNNKLLVVERAWSTGRSPSDIRVYLADLNNATDVSSISSLNKMPPKNAITKSLLVDMSTLGFFIDNIEGVTLGPILSNGHRSLAFVADDNFDKRQKSQFLLFEIIP
jgi:hypothetical protein